MHPASLIDFPRSARGPRGRPFTTMFWCACVDRLRKTASRFFWCSDLKRDSGLECGSHRRSNPGKRWPLTWSPLVSDCHGSPWTFIASSIARPIETSSSTSIAPRLRARRPAWRVSFFEHSVRLRIGGTGWTDLMNSGFQTHIAGSSMSRSRSDPMSSDQAETGFAVTAESSSPSSVCFVG